MKVFTWWQSFRKTVGFWKKSLSLNHDKIISLLFIHNTKSSYSLQNSHLREKSIRHEKLTLCYFSQGFWKLLSMCRAICFSVWTLHTLRPNVSQKHELSLSRTCQTNLEKSSEVKETLQLFASNITQTDAMNLFKQSPENRFSHNFHPRSKRPTFGKPGSLSQTVRDWCFSRRILLVVILLQHSRSFWMILPPPSRQLLLVENNFYPRSKDSIHLQLRVFPEKINVLKLC